MEARSLLGDDELHFNLAGIESHVLVVLQFPPQGVSSFLYVVFHYSTFTSS